jgi:hypothetical protein
MEAKLKIPVLIAEEIHNHNHFLPNIPDSS